MSARRQNRDELQFADDDNSSIANSDSSSIWGRVKFVVTWLGLQLYGQVRKSIQYYWNRRKSFRTYIIDHSPSFIDIDKRSREIHLERHQRSLLAEYEEGQGWWVELPDCCVVCGRPTKMPWVDEERMVEDVGRLIKVPIYIAAGSFVLSFFIGGWLLFIAGSITGILVAPRLQHSERVEVRLRRCKKHLDQTKIPRLRLFPNKLILRVGTKSIRSKFYEVGQKTRGMKRRRHDDETKQKMSALMTPVKQVTKKKDKPELSPIPLAKGKPKSSGNAPRQVAPGKEPLKNKAQPERQDSKQNESPSLTIPLANDILPVSENEPKDAPQSESILSYGNSLNVSEPEVVTPQAGDETYDFDDGEVAASAVIEKNADKVADGIVTELKGQSAKQIASIGKLGLADLFKVWGNGRYVISEGVMLTFYVTLRVVLLCGILALFVPVYDYVSTTILPDSGPRRVLNYYLIANMVCVGLASLVFQWESVYLPLTLGTLTLFGTQEFIWQKYGQPDMPVLEPDISIGFGLICLSNLPLIVFIAYAFVRSLGHISGRFMLVCEHFALEKDHVSFDRIDYRGAGRILTVIVIAAIPTILVWKAWPWATGQPWWPWPESVLHMQVAWGCAIAWAVLYFPMGVVASALAAGNAKPWIVAQWSWRLKIEYMLSLVFVGVLVGGITFALRQYLLPIIAFQWHGVTEKYVFWMLLVGIIHYLLIGLFAMLGVAARCHQNKLVFKGESDTYALKPSSR